MKKVFYQVVQGGVSLSLPDSSWETLKRAREEAQWCAKMHGGEWRVVKMTTRQMGVYKRERI